MNKFKNNFGTILEELRRKKKVSQQTVVAELGIGSQATYSSWETGRTTPNFYFLAKLADFFEVSTDTLLGRGNSLIGSSLDRSILSSSTAEEAALIEEGKVITQYISENLVKSAKNLLIDGGFISKEIFSSLLLRHRDESRHINVMTNSLDILKIWGSFPSRHKKNLEVFLTGGECDFERNILSGYFSEQVILNLFAPDAVFLEANGLSFDISTGGFYYQGTTSERVVKLAMLKKTTKDRVIACPVSKIAPLPSIAACSAIELMKNAKRTTIVTTMPENGCPEELKEQMTKFNELADYCQQKYALGDHEGLKLTFISRETKKIVKQPCSEFALH